MYLKQTKSARGEVVHLKRLDELATMIRELVEKDAKNEREHFAWLSNREAEFQKYEERKNDLRARIHSARRAYIERVEESLGSDFKVTIERVTTEPSDPKIETVRGIDREDE